MAMLQDTDALTLEPDTMTVRARKTGLLPTKRPRRRLKLFAKHQPMA